MPNILRFSLTKFTQAESAPIYIYDGGYTFKGNDISRKAHKLWSHWGIVEAQILILYFSGYSDLGKITSSSTQCSIVVKTWQNIF